MKPPKRPLLTSMLLAILVGVSAPVFAQHADHETAVLSSPKEAQTSTALRDLWMGHVFWVRNVAVSTFDGNAAAAAAAENEVVANAKQIAAAIEPYYGKAAADKLFGLLASHYGAVKQYLAATVANSKEQQDAATKALTGNAAEIATFLSAANPNLPFDTLNGLLLMHVGHHIQQIQQLTAKNYAEEAKTWDAMKKHMYVIADALAGALAKQFPAKFN